VITTRELLQLAEARGVQFSSLSSEPFAQKSLPIPALQRLLTEATTTSASSRSGSNIQNGTSGGYLISIIETLQSQHAGSTIQEKQGRNSDVIEYYLLDRDGKTEILKMARYYGFRNIQNLVRKLKPAKLRMLPGAAKGRSRAPTGKSGVGTDYCYVEVMACPGGCTNGGGQLKPDDAIKASSEADGHVHKRQEIDAKDWLAKVDEAYYSFDDEGSPEPENRTVSNGSAATSMTKHIDLFLQNWADETSILLDKLAYTTYRAVESDVGKLPGEMTTVQAAELATKIGGGW